MKKNKAVLFYEIFMFILVIASVTFIWFSNNVTNILDKIIWFIFLVDFLIRLLKSESKWEFIKKNPFDLIAIIPFDSIFRIARISRLFRLIRLFSIGVRFLKPFYGILKTNGLDKVISLTFVIIFSFSIPIQFIEPKINSFQDALWWSVVTSTTVGYGDIAPETVIGRIIAVILMISGIGLIGMITGSIATYFISGEKIEDNKIIFIKNELNRIEELKVEEIDTIIYILKQYKKDKENA